MTHLILPLMLFAAQAEDANASNAVMVDVTAGQTTEVRPDFVGYNGNLTQFNQPWDNQGVIEGVRTLAPGNFRYPAGSIGNVWDWDKGWAFGTDQIDYDKTIKWVRNVADGDKRYTLENLAKGQAAVGFEPVYMLNMIHYDVDQQILHLKKAEALGLPVRLLELGNEYYFGRGADAYMNDKFPTWEAYAKAANEWARALKKEFPDAVVVATGSSGGPSTVSERRQFWNDNVVPLLDLDVIDGITIHKYVGHGLDGVLEGNDMEKPLPGRVISLEGQQAVHEALEDPAVLATVFDQPRRSWAEMHERTMIPDMPIWLTEFNIDDRTGAVRNTWANGLFIAAYLDVFLDDGRIRLVNFHNVYGGNLYPALYPEDALGDIELAVEQGLAPTKQFALSPSGLVMREFGKAMNGRTDVARLVFANSPMMEPADGEAYPAVFGYAFDGEAAIVVNLGPEPVELAGAMLDGMTVEAVYAGTPNAYVIDAEKLHVEADGMSIPGYAIVRLAKN